MATPPSTTSPLGALPSWRPGLFGQRSNTRTRPPDEKAEGSPDPLIWRKSRQSAPEHRGVAPGHRGVALENRGVAPEHRGVAPEHRGVAPEHRGVAPEH